MSKYFTASELMTEAFKLAEDNGMFAEVGKDDFLDYHMPSFIAKDKQLKLINFDLLGDVVYGTNEGIYGEICIRGRWLPEQDEEEYMPIYTLKTLRRDKDAYMAMGHIVTTLSYYANYIIANAMERFD